MADEDPTQAAREDVKPEPGAAGEEPTHLNLKVKAQVGVKMNYDPTGRARTLLRSSPNPFMFETTEATGVASGNVALNGYRMGMWCFSRPSRPRHSGVGTKLLVCAVRWRGLMPLWHCATCATRKRCMPQASYPIQTLAWGVLF